MVTPSRIKYGHCLGTRRASTPGIGIGEHRDSGRVYSGMEGIVAKAKVGNRINLKKIGSPVLSLGAKFSGRVSPGVVGMTSENFSGAFETVLSTRESRESSTQIPDTQTDAPHLFLRANFGEAAYAGISSARRTTSFREHL